MHCLSAKLRGETLTAWQKVDFCVIASEAKQSLGESKQLNLRDCFVALLLAMTGKTTFYEFTNIT